MAIIGFTFIYILFTIGPTFQAMAITASNNAYYSNATGCYIDVPETTNDIPADPLACSSNTIASSFLSLSVSIIGLVTLIGFLKYNFKT